MDQANEAKCAVKFLTLVHLLVPTQGFHQPHRGRWIQPLRAEGPSSSCFPASSLLAPPPQDLVLQALDLTTEVAIEEDWNSIVELRLNVFTVYPDSAVRRQMAERARKKIKEARTRKAHKARQRFCLSY